MFSAFHCQSLYGSCRMKLSVDQQAVETSRHQRRSCAHLLEDYETTRASKFSTYELLFFDLRLSSSVLISFMFKKRFSIPGSSFAAMY
ncbi:hypothetical protein HZ326_12090 [Fusarium oxysporum f. sp. albedinis]|nr:hypothetical protein HZ326_12090 [Fusarium oxysporum f. sp. albedinis]